MAGRSRKGIGGRPSSYDPKFVRQAEKLCTMGATDIEIAVFFDVNVATIYSWKNQHQGFCEALKAGKEFADHRVVRSLYNRAVGYTFDSEKIVTVSDGKDGSHIERVPIKEHVPPDSTSMIFWLKNRDGKNWRDKQEHGLTDKDGNDVAGSVHDLASAMAFLLRKGIEAKP